MVSGKRLNGSMGRSEWRPVFVHMAEVRAAEERQVGVNPDTWAWQPPCAQSPGHQLLLAALPCDFSQSMTSLCPHSHPQSFPKPVPALPGCTSILLWSVVQEDGRLRGGAGAGEPFLQDSGTGKVGAERRGHTSLEIPESLLRFPPQRLHPRHWAEWENWRAELGKLCALSIMDSIPQTSAAGTQDQRTRMNTIHSLLEGGNLLRFLSLKEALRSGHSWTLK